MARSGSRGRFSGRSRRRGRGRSRRHRRHPVGLVLLVILAFAIVAGGERAVFTLVEFGSGLTLLLLLAAVFTAVRVGRRIVGRWAPEARAGSAIPRQRKAPAAEVPEADWETARKAFDALREEYAAYECDVLAVLRLPALADVTVPATARFVHAFAEAQALDTERRPPPDHLRTYVRAVEAACRAWQAARDAAERIRLAGLSPSERTAVQRVVKLLTMAAGTGNDAERQAAYAKARDELLRLERAGTITLPRLARFALDDHARGRLTA